MLAWLRGIRSDLPHKYPSQKKEYQRQYQQRPGRLEARRSVWKRLRLLVLSHYSQGTLRCACCAEAQYEFLSIDHIAGGGNQHRKALGSKYIYSWLKTHGFPEGYQVLCHNCNMAKAFYKVCPHQRLPSGASA